MQLIQFDFNLVSTSSEFLNSSLFEFFSCIYIHITHYPFLSSYKIIRTQCLSHLCRCSCIYSIFWQHFLFPGFLQNYYIFYCNNIGMAYVILLNLQLILFFVCLVIKSFRKIFMRCLTMASIIVYHITIIRNILNKMADCIEFRIVKSWSI